MPIQGTQRPTFYEGQYLGAEDLTAAITYGRDQLARHMLGGHTWGIAMGLQLKETPSPAGGDQVDISILPGYGWDGFGRTIVMLQPVTLPASLFAMFPPDGQPEGIWVPVWLRYSEIPTRGPAPGFENCRPGSASSRVQETFAVEVGPKTIDQRQAKITIAGRQLDAQAAVQSFLGAQPPELIYDESIPQQTLPEPSQSPLPRWLIPIGAVRWLPGPNAFTPGNFVKLQPDDLKASRALRRYCGVVAEEVAAADGIIRLRDRSNPYSAIRSDELVWVEGDLRIDKDARLFGGKLDLRRSDGRQGPADGSNDVPILLQRADNTAQNTVTLQVTIGKTAVKENRFSIGTLDLSDPTKPQFKEKFTVRGDGRAALGITDPQATQLTARLTIEDAQVPLSFLATGQPLTSGGLWRMALTSGVLSFDANTDTTGNFNTSSTALVMTYDGKVGIGTPTPQQTLSVAGSLNVDQLNANAGTINPGLTFGANSGEGIASRRTAGTNRFGLDFYTLFLSRMSITNDGKVGIGTTAPTQPLHVNGTIGLRQNRLYLSGDVGGSSLTYNAHRNALNNDWIFPDPSRHAVTLEMDDFGSVPRFEVYTNMAGNSAGWVRRLSIKGDSGNVIIAENGGRVGIGTNGPGTRLHVADSKDGDAADPLVHVALIENTSASSGGDVLALKVGASNPGGGNNFITFFGGNNAVGRIEGTGSNGVTLASGGADFAECLPRLYEDEMLEPGDLVGIVDGRVTRRTADAQTLTAITSQPVVLGNAPGDEEDSHYSRVALLGQVSVKVQGPVRAGDFIVPSSLNDGVGIAAAPENLSIEQSMQVAGQSWESSTEPGVKMVRIAIGLQTSSAASRLMAFILAQSEQIKILRREMDRLKD